jgi:ketosteroid isomerase-like protein
MQKQLLAAVLAGTCLVGFGASAATDPKHELVGIEANWSKAIVANDAVAVGKIVAADWTGQNPGGKFTNKEMLLANMKTGKDTAASMTNHDVHVRIVGDLAIVQGADEENSKHLGKDTSGTYNWTDVFQKRGGRWVAIASQSTLVTPQK